MAEEKITLENVESVVNSGRTVTEEIAKAAAEEIAKKRKEQLTQEFIDCVNFSEFSRKDIFISMKHANKIAEVKLNFLKKFSEKDDELKEGKLSVEDYKKEVRELRKTRDELIRAADSWREDLSEKLHNQYPKAYEYRRRLDYTL